MNKTAVITGAGGVLCAVIAKHYAKVGYSVALLDINQEAVDTLATELVAAGYSAKGYKCNVLDKDNIQAVCDAVTTDLGACTLLINGAGGNHPMASCDIEEHHQAQEGMKSFFELEQKGVDFVFNLNFMGTFLVTQVFAKVMADNGKGNIINISSMNAFCPLTKIPAYSGAKSAISNFTQWLAVYFAKSGIRVNAIAPGFFVTNQNRALLYDNDGNATARTNKILNSTPMGRFGEAEELLGCLEWLSDDDKAGFVTGIVVPIDGGFSAYSGV